MIGSAAVTNKPWNRSGFTCEKFPSCSRHSLNWGRWLSSRGAHELGLFPKSSSDVLEVFASCWREDSHWLSTGWPQRDYVLSDCDPLEVSLYISDFRVTAKQQMAYSKGPLFNGLFAKLWARLRETTRDAEAPQGYPQLNPENPGFSVSETQGGDAK